MTTILNLRSLNEWSDFWYYDIGVNVIPANTKEKQIYENWLQWQEQSIPSEVHESRKKAGYYNKGIAIMLGKIWRGPYKDKYLTAIDLDNKKAIDEFCRDGLEELKQKTIVEQTSDPDKAHIYFIIDREISNKTSDKVDISISEKIKANEIPAIEVKSNSKGIMFCISSPHRNGSNYQITGTTKPQVFPANEVEDRISLICEKYNVPYNSKTKDKSILNKVSIEVEI